jgi:hypothetical protein
VNITDDWPWSTATLTMSAPTTISTKPVHAQRGAAIRELRITAEAKYSTAISKKIIHTISTSSPCAVSAR